MGEPAEGQCFLGPGHGDVVEAALGVLVLSLAQSVPRSVQDNDVVEFQSLGAVGGEEEQPLLTAPGFLRPFGQPLYELVGGGLESARFQVVVLGCFLE